MQPKRRSHKSFQSFVLVACLLEKRESEQPSSLMLFIIQPHGSAPELERSGSVR